MSAPYGELIMVVGDAHVGQRAFDIPEKFRKMLTPDKMQYLVSTGNLCSADTYDLFRSIAPKMIAVKGDMDDQASCHTTAEEAVFEVGEFRIGVSHGHQVVPWGDREALGLLARRLDVDILITGHTHMCEAYEMEGTWFVNPGSITGAYSPIRDNVQPSFILLSIQANVVKLYMYELSNVTGEVDIRRARFTKPSKNPFQSSLDSNTLSFPSSSPPAKAPSSAPTASLPAKVSASSAPPVPKRPQAQATNKEAAVVEKQPEVKKVPVAEEQQNSEVEPASEAPETLHNAFEEAAQAAFGSSSFLPEESISAAVVEPNSGEENPPPSGTETEERWDDV